MVFRGSASLPSRLEFDHQAVPSECPKVTQVKLVP